ncbi:dipeptidase PepE [Endozoicomonas sp. 4G]|uniref:dipeptidase PepE n=1 Tax=Endozoicomonas sp. 4G TaxID=2872754 RepID=UPI002078785D|nr:dipeptidase PepE [Endozoicomonas sp. 4G]
MNLVLMSNGKIAGKDKVMEYGLETIRKVVTKTGARRFVLIPYAVIRSSHDDRVAMVQETMADLDCEVIGLHRCENPVTAIEQADGIIVSGGNTWVLNKTLHDLGLIGVIRKAVIAHQKPYIGWSAGCNIACPTIRTTNDMPIITSVVMSSLNLVPFQINPHYIDATLEGHNGETRDQRIEEFLAVNHHEVVAGLPEGTLMHVDGHELTFITANGKPMKLFRHGEEAVTYSENDSVQFLMEQGR